jgi:hypothetical protein
MDTDTPSNLQMPARRLGALPMRGRLGSVSRPVQVIKPSVSEKQEDSVLVDPFALPGFIRLDVVSDKPKRVSEAVWDAVFPADREFVRLRAGRYFRMNMNPDDAVRAACDDLEREFWEKEPQASMLVVLTSVMPSPRDTIRRLPSVWTSDAVFGVMNTAMVSRSIILADADQERSVFRNRRWHARTGKCLICGQPVASDDQTFLATDGVQDAIHKTCLPLMPRIGPVFGKLVIETIKSLSPLVSPSFPEVDENENMEGDALESDS